MISGESFFIENSESGQLLLIFTNDPRKTQQLYKANSTHAEILSVDRHTLDDLISLYPIDTRRSLNKAPRRKQRGIKSAPLSQLRISLQKS